MSDGSARRTLIEALAGDPRLSSYEKRLFSELCDFEQPPLRRHLRITNLAYNIRNRIVEALGRSGAAEPKLAIRLMNELFIDDLLTKNYICDSLLALGKLETALALNLLRALGMDPYPVVRKRVAFTITSLWPFNQAVIHHQIERWSRSEHKELREISALVMGDIRDEPNQTRLSILLRLCTDEYSQVRLKALSALRSFVPGFSRDIMTVIEKASRDSRWGIRRQVALTLEGIGRDGASQAIRLMAGLTLDVVPEVARQAALSLRAIAGSHPEASLDAMHFLAQDSNLLDLNVLKTIVDTAAGMDPHYRNKLIPILELLKHDDDSHIRRSASSVLAGLRN